MTRYLSLFVAILLLSPPARAEHRDDDRVAWRDLHTLIGGRKITLVLPSGVELKGRVLAVDEQRLVLDVRKTSDERTQPKGRAEIPRASVRSFAMTRNRNIWKAVGAAAGLGAGLAIAIPVNTYSHNEGDGAPLAVAAAIAVPTALGFLAGLSADRKMVTISVID